MTNSVYIEIPVDSDLAGRLREDSMKRMRWRLWFLFAESKYMQFCYKGNKKKPHWENIKAFCREHWGKEIKDMTDKELSKCIGLVKKWK